MLRLHEYRKEIRRNERIDEAVTLQELRES